MQVLSEVGLALAVLHPWPKGAKPGFRWSRSRKAQAGAPRGCLTKGPSDERLSCNVRHRRAAGLQGR